MTPEQAEQLIGLPYAKDGFGPDEYNCWGLLVHIQNVYFGRNVPILPLGNPEVALQMAKGLIVNGEWHPADEPMHGDAVLLRGGDSAHVGVYLDIDSGGVIHSLEDVGVVFTLRKYLNRLNFSRHKFYRHVDAR